MLFPIIPWLILFYQLQNLDELSFGNQCSIAFFDSIEIMGYNHLQATSHKQKSVTQMVPAEESLAKELSD